MVSIRGLVKRFSNVSAVAGIDLEVQRGEFVALLGPSGCGKTTTLRCVAGLEGIDEGEIIVDGHSVSTSSASIPPEKRGIGMVFQSYALWPHMTVFQNVAFGLKLKGMNKHEISERVNKILDLVGLSGLGDRGVSQLSGGQQQRVSLSRALVIEPKVLLFDEPLSNLDAVLRERMRFELRQVQQRLGITSIYVTHDQQEAFVIADRILLMHQGKIIQEGKPEEIYNRPRSKFVAEFVGLVNLFEGTVVTNHPTGINVQLATGLELQCDDRSFSPDQLVNLIIRPEEIIILEGPTREANVFKAKVKRLVFLGSYADAYLQVDGVELRAQVSPPRALSLEQEVNIRISPSKIILTPRYSALAGFVGEK